MLRCCGAMVLGAVVLWCCGAACRMLLAWAAAPCTWPSEPAAPYPSPFASSTLLDGITVLENATAIPHYGAVGAGSRRQCANSVRPCAAAVFRASAAAGVCPTPVSALLGVAGWARHHVSSAPMRALWSAASPTRRTRVRQTLVAGPLLGSDAGPTPVPNPNHRAPGLAQRAHVLGVYLASACRTSG